MRLICFLVAGILLIGFQTTIFQIMPSWLGSPDLVFILVAFIAYRFALLTGLFLVFTLGWMMDIVSGIYLGTYVVEYVLLFACLSLLTANSPIKESVYQVPLVGAGYFLAQFILYFILSIMVSDGLPPWLWDRVLRETILLTMATIPCFLLFNSLNEFLLKKKVLRRISQRKKSGNQFR
ncbi:MAG: hypothetical protein CSA26_09455 [Desulfobacterales bacterium]|nr:MAG: hypothetical protein CSA26_09455 [Desulfobacterales bacterium]